MTSKKDMVHAALVARVEDLREIISQGMGTQPSNACAMRLKANKAELKAYECLVAGKTRAALQWMKRAGEIRGIIGT